MQDLNTFYDWMQASAMKTETTARHYKSGLSACSKDFLRWGLVDKPLTELSLTELDIVIQKAFLNSSFNEKNCRGNNMYSNALKQYRNFIADNGAILLDTSYERFIGETVSSTLRETVVQSRIGQGLFRKKLFEKYEGRCVVTGIKDKRLLLASHIRPWSVSTNEQRLSSENGLLLSPLYDRLFDVGLITFDDDGRIVCSKELDNRNIDLLNIDRSCKHELKVTAEFLDNLRYHQKVIFLGGM